MARFALPMNPDANVRGDSVNNTNRIIAVRMCSEEQIEAQREKVEEVVQRLRSKLPADKAAQLSSFDSYGLLDLYNHHHTNQDTTRLGPTPTANY